MKFLLAITLALALASSEQSFLDSEPQAKISLVLVSDSSVWVVGPQVPRGGPAVIVPDTYRTASIPGANWITDGPNSVLGTSSFFSSFIVTDKPSKATLEIAADDGSKVFINGVNVGLDSDVATLFKTTQKSGDVTAFVKVGLNILTVEVTNTENTSALLFKLTIS